MVTPAFYIIFFDLCKALKIYLIKMLFQWNHLNHPFFEPLSCVLPFCSISIFTKAVVSYLKFSRLIMMSYYSAILFYHVTDLIFFDISNFLRTFSFFSFSFLGL